VCVCDHVCVYAFIPTFVQTSGIGQASVDVWVAPHGLHCHSLYTGRLFLQFTGCEQAA
jgi:hypothetical protein